MLPQQEVYELVERVARIQTYMVPVTGPGINLHTKKVPNKHQI